jgi:hypothetical protein
MVWDEAIKRAGIHEERAPFLIAAIVIVSAFE